MANAENKPIVMLVDESPEQMGMIEAMISSDQPGCIFVRAHSIKKAIEILRGNVPNLVIMEAHFQDGEATELLQAFPRAQRQFTCLVVTNDKSEETLKQVFEQGADDLILKPIDDLIFHSKMRSLLSQQYISPLSFLGRRQGLADISFSASIQILEINEDSVRFLNSFPLAKQSVLELQLHDFQLKINVQTNERSERFAGSFEIHANVEPLNELRKCALRRLIIELKGSHS